jgi:C-terminal processing protease CtpA/Prc
MKILSFALWLFLIHPLWGDMDARALGAEDFQVRETAQEEMLHWAKNANPAKKTESIFESYISAVDPERKARLKEVLFQLQRNSVPRTGSGAIGISMNEFLRFNNRLPPEELRGVVVVSVIEGTPAESAGVQVNDRILAIDDEKIASANPIRELQGIVAGKVPGSEVTLKIMREGKEISLPLTLISSETLPSRNGDSLKANLQAGEKHLRRDFQKWLLAKEKKYQSN